MVFIFFINIRAKTFLDTFYEVFVINKASITEIWKLTFSHWIDVSVRIVKLTFYGFISPANNGIGFKISSKLLHVDSDWSENCFHQIIIVIVDKL